MEMFALSVTVGKIITFKLQNGSIQKVEGHELQRRRKRRRMDFYGVRYREKMVDLDSQAVSAFDHNPPTDRVIQVDGHRQADDSNRRQCNAISAKNV